jgi:hypothetical protein
MPGREKRKRKKSRERRKQLPAPVPVQPQPVEPSKSKDDLARERLVPLEEGERPAAVTVAAIVAALLALSNLIGWAAGIEINGETPSPGAVLPPAILMIVMAVGMWQARYWAVLGFQTVLAFLIVFMSLLLVKAGNLFAVVAAVTIIAAAGTLFWFLVQSLARIQMPERRPR